MLRFNCHICCIEFEQKSIPESNPFWKHIHIEPKNAQQINEQQMNERINQNSYELNEWCATVWPCGGVINARMQFYYARVCRKRCNSSDHNVYIISAGANLGTLTLYAMQASKQQTAE